ncbi:putative glutathione-specific gamma-glutamylcyclotransferase 2 [Smittium culicis]|uniref:glutathione-specific gamma-glutamylcyclotransferase n=1 Tax=Smittium culicis TaxID=133412 RepID=A0A1R1YTR0_9FUNG|nr:putative glutathione-specific gamma-glutamylcyclotransferase 2 [Smittium culicis]
MTNDYSDGVWIFGYGSLIWKVDFPIEDQAFGYISGYVRRFWQKSHDHRGTEESPGFVVTLIEKDTFLNFENTTDDEHDFKCWGMAYKIKSGEEDQVLKHLDHREKVLMNFLFINYNFFNDGYTIHKVKVYSDLPGEKTGPKVLLNNAIVYIGKEDNPSFGGPLDITTISKTVAFNVGPSGTNLEYFVNLFEALKSKSPHALDNHLVQLHSAVMNLVKSSIDQS